MPAIRIAEEQDYPRVREFYYDLIDAMADSEFKPGWEKDVYPTQEFLVQSIENGELYLAETAEGLAACMVVNHAYNDGYRDIRWAVDAADEELCVIHALGVHPRFAGQGIAKQLVARVIGDARRQGLKAIRLDVLEGNLPAERAYTRMGFAYRGTLKMFYEDTGWTAFRLFEYLL